jgi:hypothetical protein
MSLVHPRLYRTLRELIDLMVPLVRFCDQHNIPLKTTGGGKCAWSPEVKRAAQQLHLPELPSPPTFSSRFGTIHTAFALCRRIIAGERLTGEAIQQAIDNPVASPYRGPRTSEPAAIEVIAEVVTPEVVEPTAVVVMPLRPAPAIPMTVQQAAQGLISKNEELQDLLDEAQEELANRQQRIEDLERRLATPAEPVDAMVGAAGKVLWDNRDLITADPAKFRRFLTTFAHALGAIE